MVEKQNIIVPLSEKADLVVSNLIERHGLEENEEETLKKLKENKLFNSSIIVKLTRDFVKETISEKELVESLKKGLEIPQQAAEKISKDIINNLVPLLEKIPEKELRETKTEKEVGGGPTITMPVKPPIDLEKVPPKKEIPEPTFNKPLQVKKPPTPKIPEEIKETKTSKKGDTYREPIN